MMPRMEGFIQELIHMHGTVKEILPCVNNEPVRKSLTQEKERERETYIANKNWNKGTAHQYINQAAFAVSK